MAEAVSVLPDTLVTAFTKIQRFENNLPPEYKHDFNVAIGDAVRLAESAINSAVDKGIQSQKSSGLVKNVEQHIADSVLDSVEIDINKKISEN